MPDATTEGLDTFEELPARRIMAIVGALMCGNLLAVIDSTIVAVALPTISTELGNAADQAWILVSYMLASTAMVPIYGKLSDLYGRKQVYQYAISVFLVGSLACGIAQTIPQLLAARVVQGIGAGGIMVTALAIVGEVVSPRQRGRYQAYFTMMASAGIVAGPAVGGVILDALSWRWVFWLNLPIGFVALVVIAAVLESGHVRIEHRIDYFGSILVIGAVVAFLMAMVWGGQRYAWGSGTIVGLLIASAVLLAAFVLQERRVAEPVVPLHLMRNRAVVVSAGFSFFVSLTVLGGTLIPVQQFLQVVEGVKASDVWQYLASFAIMNMIVAIATGRLIARTGTYRIFPILSAIGLTACMVMMLAVTVDTGGGFIAVYLGLLGFTMGLGSVVPVMAAQNEVSREDLGATTGVINFFQQLGGSVGAAAFGTIFATRVTDRLGALVSAGDVSAGDAYGGPDVIRGLAEPARTLVRTSYADAIQGVYPWAIASGLIAVGVSLLLREAPLKTWSFAARDAAVAPPVH